MLDPFLPWRLEAQFVVLAASTALFGSLSIWWLVLRKARRPDSR